MSAEDTSGAKVYLVSNDNATLQVGRRVRDPGHYKVAELSLHSKVP
ncbi:hypothetical protein VB005_10317 [Metarhizium brunneum]